jgi:hypothetical protein
LRIDLNQARIDVELFLRDKFKEVRGQYPSSFAPSTSSGPGWPAEIDFLKVANAASGHFGFASVVMNFILDEECGNPISQLKTVLNIIDKTPLSQPEPNPLILLDNLYAEILSAIPLNVLPLTKTLLAWSFGDCFYYLKLSSGFSSGPPCSLFYIANLLGLSQADIYGAVQKLHSVVNISSPEDVEIGTRLEPYHTILRSRTTLRHRPVQGNTTFQTYPTKC